MPPVVKLENPLLVLSIKLDSVYPTRNDSPSVKRFSTWI